MKFNLDNAGNHTIDFDGFNLFRRRGGAAKPALEGFEAGVQYAVSTQRRLMPGYTGPLFRVIRSSDNTEYDVGFSSSTNEVDVKGLINFSDESILSVNRLYIQDNSGRYYVPPVGEESVRTPRIANFKNLYKINGKLALYFFFGSGLINPPALVLAHNSADNVLGGLGEVAVTRYFDFDDPYGTVVSKGTAHGMAVNSGYPEVHGTIDGAYVAAPNYDAVKGNKVIVMGHDWTPANTNQKLYIDGIEVGTGYAPETFSNTSDSIFGFGTWGHKGWIGEYILLNSIGKLNLPAITTLLNDYWKPGLIKDLWFDGDSLNVGVGSTVLTGQTYQTNPYPFPTILKATGTGLRKSNNIGVNGQTMADMLADIDTHIAAMNQSADKLIVSYWGAVNGFTSTAITPQQQYDLAVQYAQAVKAGAPSAKVIIMGPIPVGPGLEFQFPGTTAKLIAYDNLLQANNSFADAYLRLYDKFTPGDYTVYHVDDIHLVDKGYGRVAYYLDQIIESF